MGPEEVVNGILLQSETVMDQKATEAAYPLNEKAVS